MDRERWQQVDTIFKSALERAPADRAHFLDAACAGDAELREEVESLIAHDEAESFMAAPACAEAARLLAEDEPDALAGQTIGSYQILEKIGAGGMGEVYLAIHAGTNRKVALKFLPARLTTNQEHVRRFQREAQAVLALNHPNILTIYEVAREDSAHYIVTEFVDGESLRQRIRRAELELPEALDVAIQIASALVAAHEAGIVHRDIKPENVMLRPDGYVKVLDFGLAKLAVETADARREETDAEAQTQAMVNTAPGVVMGTPSYMSPEQARGLAVDARTDLWSLGIVLYEMIAGHSPFASETLGDCIAAILTSEPSTIQDAPAELQRILKKSLRKDRGERYQTARDFLIDLKTLRKRLEFETEFSKFGVPSSGGNERGKPETQILSGRPTGEKESPKGGTPNARSIAVLPFANTSNDPENEYFCDGLAEELLNALAKIKDLKVAARTSAFSFKNRNVDASEIGNTLNVKTILEGSVRKAGQRLRISVQLINAVDGYQIWSERYDGEFKDIFDLQDEITLAVIDELKVKLLSEDKAALRNRYVENVEAYRLYLKGRYYWYKFPAKEYEKSRDYYQQAIDVDPNYALAYAGLSEYYGFGAASGFLPPSNENWSKAAAAANKALELDAMLPDGYNALAGVKQFSNDRAGAERDLKRAIELNPKYAEGYTHYAHFLIEGERFEEAVAQMTKALELEPFNVLFNRQYGSMFYRAREYDRAIEQYRKTLELDPNDAATREFLGDAYEQKGMQKEAVAEWSRALMLTGEVEAATTLERAYAASGFNAAVRSLWQKKLEQFDEKAKRGEYVPAINYALAYARLEDKEQAFAWLAKAEQERNTLRFDVKLVPIYDSLRDDSRFQDLLKRVDKMRL